jgi:hypothetical protein
MKTIKLMFSRTDEQMFKLESESEYTFTCFYYDYFKEEVSNVRVTFNKSKLLGWEIKE